MSISSKSFFFLSFILLIAVEWRCVYSQRQYGGLGKSWHDISKDKTLRYSYERYNLIYNLMTKKSDKLDKDSICRRLWNVDYVNRLYRGREFDVSMQTKVSQVSNQDNASLPLFKYLKLSAMRSRPTFRTFEELLFNFEPSPEGAAIVKANSNQTQGKINRFLKEVSKTMVFSQLYWFLVRNKYISGNKLKFRQDLFRIWFNAKNASRDRLSGFHRIFVGEIVSNPVKISFRNWLQFYSLETNQSLNYHGYFRFISDLMIISPLFSWGAGATVSDNMFFGTSPEFELALYTLCFYTNPGRHCKCKLSTRTIHVTTILSINGQTIKDAFFELKT